MIFERDIVGNKIHLFSCFLYYNYFGIQISYNRLACINAGPSNIRYSYFKYIYFLLVYLPSGPYLILLSGLFMFRSSILNINIDNAIVLMDPEYAPLEDRTLFS